MDTHLLLLHQLRVRTVIHHVLAKDWGRERTVNLLRIDILQLPVQNEIVALGAQTHSRLLAQKNEGEDLAVLLTAGEEELVRIYAVRDGAADEGHQVEHDRRFIRVAEEQLLCDVEKDDGGDEGGDGEGNATPG